LEKPGFSWLLLRALEDNVRQLGCLAGLHGKIDAVLPETLRRLIRRNLIRGARYQVGERDAAVSIRDGAVGVVCAVHACQPYAAVRPEILCLVDHLIDVDGIRVGRDARPDLRPITRTGLPCSSTKRTVAVPHGASFYRNGFPAGLFAGEVDRGAQAVVGIQEEDVGYLALTSGMATLNRPSLTPIAGILAINRPPS